MQNAKLYSSDLNEAFAGLCEIEGAMLTSPSPESVESSPLSIGRIKQVIEGLQQYINTETGMFDAGCFPVGTTPVVLRFLIIAAGSDLLGEMNQISPSSKGSVDQADTLKLFILAITSERPIRELSSLCGFREETNAKRRYRKYIYALAERMKEFASENSIDIDINAAVHDLEQLFAVRGRHFSLSPSVNRRRPLVEGEG